MKMLVFFLAKCVRNAVKTMVVDRKNQKALALLYLASKPLRKAANSSGVPTEFEQNRRGKMKIFKYFLSELPPNSTTRNIFISVACNLLSKVIYCHDLSQK